MQVFTHTVSSPQARSARRVRAEAHRVRIRSPRGVLKVWGRYSLFQWHSNAMHLCVCTVLGCHIHSASSALFFEVPKWRILRQSLNPFPRSTKGLSKCFHRSFTLQAASTVLTASRRYSDRCSMHAYMLSCSTVLMPHTKTQAPITPPHTMTVKSKDCPGQGEG